MPKSPRNNRIQAASVLEKAILNGLLKPGMRLPEMRLASELGVSQASVREALQTLEGLGLVVKTPNHGSQVTQLSQEDLVYIYQVRGELEPLACSLAIAHLTTDIIGELQGCIDAMRSAGERSDFQAFSGADVSFHRIIWKSQPNRFLEKSLLTVCLPLFAFDLIRRRATPRVNFTRVANQHQLILDTLQTQNTIRIAKLIRRMNERWMRQDLADYAEIQRTTTAIDTSSDDPFALLSENIPG